ncbi:hypothetical protein R3W88_033690 [Solanum pinnatisectum]|uniref:F-box associated beta-propeller type 3 domain-containing protein n=1 Tax=Solanum pinnatisectum TaxID=50273 RepID=A0AAV9K073_9SOLN|nr:hypothetical protein R3W88_033690 [Solanum pinnatisectum]
MDSINGLICLVDWSNNLFIWNPSIRKYKKLPDSKSNLIDAINFIYGFGYDKFREDYKIEACTYYHGHLHNVEVQIYSLKSDSWRSINCLNKGVRIYRSCKFVNGKIYWTSYTFSDRYIIYIDLVNEKWIKVEQPSYEEEDYDLQLGIYGSDLSDYINNRRKFVSLWVIKKSWTKIFSIKYDDSPFSYVLPFFMSNKGEIMVCFASTNFMIDNPNDESLRPAVIDSNEFSYAEIYIEGLVSSFST